MDKLKTALPLIIGAIVIMGLSTYLPTEQPVISVKAEHLFWIGPLNVTNSMLTSWLVIIIAVVGFVIGLRNMQLKPSGLQNFLEFLYENLYQLTENVAGPKHAAKFFALPATIFIYVILSNWLALFPGLPLMGVGLCEEHHVEAKAETTEHKAEAEHGEATEHKAEAGHGEAKAWKTCKPGEVIVPFLRSPSADLNNTFSLAIVTQVLAQIFGITILGLGGYASKFFVTQKLTSPKSGGDFALGIIDFLVGLLELLSEFIKVVAYTFRLYGNIFAGEVTVMIVVFFIPLFAVLPMLMFEVFVGFIQAFVFFILSVAFYTLATTAHGGHDEAH